MIRADINKTEDRKNRIQKKDSPLKRPAKLTDFCSIDQKMGKDSC